MQKRDSQAQPQSKWSQNRAPTHYTGHCGSSIAIMLSLQGTSSLQRRHFWCRTNLGSLPAVRFLKTEHSSLEVTKAPEFARLSSTPVPFQRRNWRKRATSANLLEGHQ